MSDLTEIQSSGSVKISGADSSGVENNYANIDAQGNLYTVQRPGSGQLATYAASVTGLLSAVASTDIFTITGSATKTIRVTRVQVSGVQTTLGDVNLIILKRSTANSGGTSTTPTVVPYDSTDAAGTAIVRAYTTNPTLGTLIGNIQSTKLFVPTSTSNSAGIVLDQLYKIGSAKSIVLRGTSEVFSVNLNATTVAGGNFNIAIEWTEE